MGAGERLASRLLDSMDKLWVNKLGVIQGSFLGVNKLGVSQGCFLCNDVRAPHRRPFLVRKRTLVVP